MVLVRFPRNKYTFFKKFQRNLKAPKSCFNREDIGALLERSQFDTRKLHRHNQMLFASHKVRVVSVR